MLNMDVFIRFAFSLCLRNIYCHLIESSFSVAIINLYSEHAAHFTKVHICCICIMQIQVACKKHAKHMLHCPRILNMHPYATCMYIAEYAAH